MVYVALLRGINVGGKNRVEMSQLKTIFEQLGFTDVKTYINSGNVVFRDASHSLKELVGIIETAAEKEFSFNVKVLIRRRENIIALTKSVPASWVNDQTMKCDVLFLWDDVDSPKVIDQLSIRPEIDDVKYVDGALIWCVDRSNATKSGLLKIIGTDLYKKMTIRNLNTLRKLEALMSAYN